MKALIEQLPKVELHVHIEGTLAPERMLMLADQNEVRLPYENLKAVQEAYNFDSLQSFLDLYYLGASVLITELDFYHLMRDYLNDAIEQNIVHCEVMFDPQTHLARGIGFDVFMPGFIRAMREVYDESGLTVQLILCFLRDLPETDALKTLDLALPYLSDVTGVGLDSAEVGHPPLKFERAFLAARKLGLRPVAHAGEEGSSDMIAQALDVLRVERIDHGVACVEDEALRRRLIDERIPLTMCPLSNIKLCVFEQMAQHPILDLLDQGLCVTVNSDDPAYFGGNLVQNFLALYETFDVSERQLRQLVVNSVNGAFLANERKQALLDQLL
ncbi:MAG: adenosine deaminase [Pseudomonadales bacterium]